jgi:hypothetical protein
VVGSAVFFGLVLRGLGLSLPLVGPWVNPPQAALPFAAPAPSAPAAHQEERRAMKLLGGGGDLFHIVLMAAPGPVTAFEEAHPTVKILVLGYLIMIGVALVADGFDSGVRVQERRDGNR